MDGQQHHKHRWVFGSTGRGQGDTRWCSNTHCTWFVDLISFAAAVVESNRDVVLTGHLVISTAFRFVQTYALIMGLIFENHYDIYCYIMLDFISLSNCYLNMLFGASDAGANLGGDGFNTTLDPGRFNELPLTYVRWDRYKEVLGWAPLLNSSCRRLGILIAETVIQSFLVLLQCLFAVCYRLLRVL